MKPSASNALRQRSSSYRAQADSSSLPIPAYGSLTRTARSAYSRVREASWSPFGRFIVATTQNELAALEPGGDVRWTLARADVHFPRWAGTQTDTRIAYLSGTTLRVVGGDGRGDHALASRVHPVAPAWRPRGGYVLTYVDDHTNQVVTLDVDRQRVLWRAPSHGAVETLEWSSDGRRLHVRRAGRLDVLTRRGKPWTGLHPPRGGSITASTIAPRSHAFAGAVARGAGSEILLVSEGGGRVFAGEGRFTDLTWSPDGHWLLVGLPNADQWVFVRPDEGRILAVSDVARQFRSRSFPRVEGWCCTR